MKQYYYVAEIEYNMANFKGMCACVLHFSEGENIFHYLPNNSTETVRRLYPMPSKKRAQEVADAFDKSFKAAGLYPAAYWEKGDKS